MILKWILNVHGMRVRTGFMWLEIYTFWGFYVYNNEHKRGDFLGWATVTGFVSVSSVDDSWIKSNFLGQGPQPLLWAGSRTALLKNHNKCYT